MFATFPVVAASSCEGRGAAVAAAGVSLAQDARGRWVTHAVWGCGCPTGPAFTLAYEPNTSPLEIRLCLDQRQDTCERGCGMPIAWDMDAPMRASHATTVRVVQ